MSSCHGKAEVCTHWCPKPPSRIRDYWKPRRCGCSGVASRQTPADIGAAPAHRSAGRTSSAVSGAADSTNPNAGGHRLSFSRAAVPAPARARMQSGHRPPFRAGGDGRPAALLSDSSSSAPEDQRQDEQDDEDDEQDLGDRGRETGDAEEPEEPCDQRNDEEYDRVVKHAGTPIRSGDGPWATNSAGAGAAHTAKKTPDMPSLACPEFTESAPLAETKPIRCDGSCACFPGARWTIVRDASCVARGAASGGFIRLRAVADVSGGDASSSSVLHAACLRHLQVRGIHVLHAADPQRFTARLRDVALGRDRAAERGGAVVERDVHV